MGFMARDKARNELMMIRAFAAAQGGRSPEQERYLKELQRMGTEPGVEVRTARGPTMEERAYAKQNFPWAMG